MTKVYDPQGNELTPMLVQILQRNDKGKPTRLWLRHSDEKIRLEDDAALGDMTPDANKFFLLWAPAEMDEGVFSFDNIAKRIHDVQLELEDTRKTFEDAKLRVTVEIQNRARVEAELEQKTASLRELQKERDPEKLERMVKERCADLERLLELERASSAAEVSKLTSEINELRASKKKLREALERAKHDGKR